MEPAQKELLLKLAYDLGLSLSATVRMVLGQAVRSDTVFLSRVFKPRKNHQQLFKVTDYRDG